MSHLPSSARRVFGSFLCSAFLAFLSPTAPAAGDLPKDIAARLAPQWLANAKQIRTPEHVIFYKGAATGGTAPDGKHWAGEIEGEILVLTPDMATACVKFRLSATGAVSIEGRHESKLVGDVVPWQKLLDKPN